jgi:hypothetical protein
VREHSDKVYGIPPEQAAGITQPIKYGYDNDRRPILDMEPELSLNNLGAGEIENFWKEYGRRPNAAFGNSPSEARICEGRRRGEAVGAGRHDDSIREYAYGPAQSLPNTGVGTLSQAMYDMAKEQGWAIISMKNDCKRISPFDWPPLAP